jgi:hypothetical protein
MKTFSNKKIWNRFQGIFFEVKKLLRDNFCVIFFETLWIKKFAKSFKEKIMQKILEWHNIQKNPRKIKRKNFGMAQYSEKS